MWKDLSTVEVATTSNGWRYVSMVLGLIVLEYSFQMHLYSMLVCLEIAASLLGKYGMFIYAVD